MDLDKTTIIQVANKLIGPIVPIGEPAEDIFRLEALKTQYSVIRSFLSGFMRLASDKDSKSKSMSEAGMTADRFIKDINKMTAAPIEGLDHVIDLMYGEDGETVEYIINKIGMRDQILRQLIMGSSDQAIQELLDEKWDAK